MLTISDFLAGVDPKILERGKGYFADGAVRDLAADGDLWTAGVEGSEDYTVELRVNGKGEIASWNCDCPYEYGDVCKHVVAVCCAVQKQREKPKPKKPPAAKTFDALLDKISAEECKEFIRRHAAADKNFRTKFEIAFSGKDKSIDLETKYRELIRKIIRRYGKYDYWDYAASNALGHEITQILDRDGAAMQAEGNFAGAFALAKACVKELIKTIGACDDSNGEVGDSLASAIGLLRNVAESPNVAADLKEVMFAFLHGELPDSEYFDYGDFGYDMFQIFTGLATLLGKDKEYLGLLDTCLRAADTEYERKFFLTEKIAFLRHGGKTEAAEQLIAENLDIPELRLMQVDAAIEGGQYTLAKKLIAEGIHIAEGKKHHGTVRDWREKLLDIAYREKDKLTARALTYDFAFAAGRFDEKYYRKWKATFSATEWPGELSKLIAARRAEAKAETGSMAKGRYYGPRESPSLWLLGPLYVEEKMWNELMALIQSGSSLRALLEYHGYLAPRFPDKMIDLYFPVFLDAGDKADKRGAYADLSRKMCHVITSIPQGKERIQQAARQLIAKYPRRPAMIEELGKVLKM